MSISIGLISGIEGNGDGSGFEAESDLVFPKDYFFCFSQT